LNTKFPGVIEALAESQTITINYQPQPFVFRSFCRINYSGNKAPSKEVLLYERREQESYVSSEKKPHRLYPREMVAVSSLSCLISKENRDYYLPVTIPVVFNMVGEPTSLRIQSFNTTADTIRVSVITVIPSFVWCEAFSDLFYYPTTHEVMRGKKYYSISSVTAEVNSLVPGTVYRVFCYAESVAHVTMKEPLANCTVTAKTKRVEYSFDTWKEEYGMLQFSIHSNIQSPFLCLILRNQHIYSVNPINGLYSIPHRGSCLVKCHVSVGDSRVSMSHKCLGQNNITVLSMVYDATRNHYCAIVFIFALGLFVCAVVLFWRRKSWRYTRLPNPTDVFYVS